MTRRCRKLTRSVLFSLLLLSLSVRVLIPAGFMPSSLAAGGPLVICPDGLFSFELDLATSPTVASERGLQDGKHGSHHGDHQGDHHQQHGGQDQSHADGIDGDQSAGHHHEESSGHSSFSMESCPIGSVLGAAAAPAMEASLLIAFFATATPLFNQPGLFRSFTSRLYHARAPPLATPFYA